MLSTETLPETWKPSGSIQYLLVLGGISKCMHKLQIQNDYAMLCLGLDLFGLFGYGLFYCTLLLTPTPCPNFLLHTNIIITIDFLEPTTWICVAQTLSKNQWRSPTIMYIYVYIYICMYSIVFRYLPKVKHPGYPSSVRQQPWDNLNNFRHASWSYGDWGTIYDRSALAHQLMVPVVPVVPEYDSLGFLGTQKMGFVRVGAANEQVKQTSHQV